MSRIETPIPDTYLGVPAPDEIKEQWRRWEGAEWRKARYRGTNRRWPPDERFNVHAPEGMCPVHWQMRIGYRNMHFDYRTGNAWPGHPGSMFTIIEADIGEALERRRCEWDEKASEQMRLIEEICLSGRSPQCDRDDGPS